MRKPLSFRGQAAELQQELAQLETMIGEQTNKVDEVQIVIDTLQESAQQLADSDCSDEPEVVAATAAVRQEAMAASMRYSDEAAKLEELVSTYDEGQATLQEMQQAEAA